MNPSEREKRSIALKQKIENLNIQEPFTKREEKGLGQKNMAFVRDLQIARGISKKEAIKLYADSNLKSKDQFKKLVRKTKRDLDTYYGKKSEVRISASGDFIQPKTKKQVLIEQKKKDWIKSEKVKIKNYFASEKNKRFKTYPRTLKNHRVYPDATIYELTHGVESKASQRYRLNHGLEQHYTGRVKNVKNK